jgi:uncharacterized damage-inducible protein DinB
MHSSIEMSWSWIQAMNGLRSELLATLADSELAFGPGGANPALGDLLVQMGEIEHSYTSSFVHFTQDWDYRNSDASLRTSVAALTAWFQSLDQELEAALNALGDDAPQRQITRPGGGAMPVDFQLQTYMQAMFIFFGKFVVYFRAMNKPLPQHVEDYIG